MEKGVEKNVGKTEMEHSSASKLKKQEIIQKLRTQNYRITNQRMMILDIILDGGCTCCKEIYYKAAKKDPGIGTATVYRMVNTLEDIGVISRKNMYQIQCSHWEEEEGTCKIILEDQSEIKLSNQKWKQVVASGLKSCGIVEDQNLKSIELAGKCF